MWRAYTQSCTVKLSLIVSGFFSARMKIHQTLILLYTRFHFFCLFFIRCCCCLVVGHRVLKDLCELFCSWFSGRCELGNTVLRQCTFNQLRNHGAVKAQTLQTVGHIQILQETGQLFSQDFAGCRRLDGGGVGAKGDSGVNVSIRASAGCEAEDRWSGQSDRDTVRYNGVINVVSRVLVSLVQTANRVTQAVAQVDTGVAKANTIQANND